MNNSHLIVLTGYSGAGKSTASKALEDLGYYTVDNMPLSLVEKFVQVVFDYNSEIQKIALVIDARSKDIPKIAEVVKFLKSKYYVEVIFLDATEDILVRRYKETRRKHPLGDNLLDSIRLEKKLMEEIKELSDIIIDTSSMTVHDLTKLFDEKFREMDSSKMSITIQSFGFKYGIPQDSDMVIDVRFLKNPHFVDELRGKTGLEKDVYDYVFSDERCKVFLRKLKAFLEFLIPNYVKEGKKFFTLSIGCTGGKHRSVALAQFIGEYLKNRYDNKVYIKHRDIERG
ncbi:MULTISPECIES: RNase adapter RapZ [Calditerrivibrio]|uniref:RNase adapter RapZ n=1 Tax=Calditerrivibrio nitroreducens TaxID=477976 RepID=A0A2J6WG78_9BACT|nr:MAG: RNase adapter RapZ [Calditerrivibrio nitroreducens]